MKFVSMTVIDDRTGLQTDTSTFGTRMKRYRTMAKLGIAKLADYLKREYGELALSENVLTNIELGRKTDLTLPWLKPRDSCELGLLGFRRYV